MGHNLDIQRVPRVLNSVLFKPRLVLVVGLLAFYLCEVVDLRLVFEGRAGLFLWNLRYFTDFIGRPGSLLNWADSLLVQLCYYNWPAALVLSVAAWLLLISTIGLMNATARVEVAGTWLIPGIALFALYGGYSTHTSLLLGAALAVAAANSWVRVAAGGFGVPVAVFVALSIAVYYVAGEAFYCFAACCLVYAALARRSGRLGLALVLAGTGVKFGLDATLAKLHLATQNFSVPSLEEVSLDWQAALFCGYFPLCAAWVVFLQTSVGQRLRTILDRKEPRKTRKGRPLKPAAQPKGAAPARAFSWSRWTAGTVLMLLLAGAAGFYSIDWNGKAGLELEYCVDHQQWNEVLARARNLREYSRFTSHDVMLALYHTGRLPYELFAYPQPLGAHGILFDKWQVPKDAVKMLRKPCDWLLELGLVNDAEHTALEMLELCPTGETLKRLALIKIIKGQPAAAGVFLNVLRDDLVWGRWAEGCLERLKTQPDLAGDEEVQQIRRLMLLQDDTDQVCTIKPNNTVDLAYGLALFDLLDRNASNRMAFEYCMASSLLERNLEAAIELLPRATNFSYPTMPPYFEEALVLYGVQHPGELAENPSGLFVRGRRISNTTTEKYHRFLTLMGQTGGSFERAVPEVVREMPDSYFSYYVRQSETRHDE
ncbi:MAG: DUF6057 family protein [Verrucomicrobiota bacterium]